MSRPAAMIWGRLLAKISKKKNDNKEEERGERGVHIFLDSTAKTFIVHIFFCRKRQVEMLTSPFKYALLIMCSASDANSSGFPRRDGQGIPCVLISSLGMQDADTNIESGNKNR